MKSSSHRDVISKMPCCKYNNMPVEYHDYPELQIQSYSLLILPETERNSMEFLYYAPPVKEDYFMPFCACEDFRIKNSQVSLGYLNDLSGSHNSSSDDYCMLNFEKDLEL